MVLKSVSFGNRMFYSELKSPFQKVFPLVLSKETLKELWECFEFYRQISEWIILGNWTATGWVHWIVFCADFCHFILQILTLKWEPLISDRLSSPSSMKRPATAERDSRGRQCVEPEHVHILLKVYFDYTRVNWGKNNCDGVGEDRKVVIRMFLNCP